MERKRIRILMIENNPEDIQLIQKMLAEVKGTGFSLEYAGRLSEGLALLSKREIDVVLLDLSLPDSKGFDALVRIHMRAPAVPIIVLTGIDDETFGVEAVKKGAQDYLVKVHVNPTLLVRSIHYAIERHRLLEEVRSLSLMDDLTGLYNRRGFFTLSRQQLKMANRVKRSMFLLFADMDDLKAINDSLGHIEGDRALVDVADLLKKTFRESDIIGRIGGDEFTVLAIETRGATVNGVRTRFKRKLRSHNKKGKRPYTLSLSFGVVCYDTEQPQSIEELVDLADKSMYESKKNDQRS